MSIFTFLLNSKLTFFANIVKSNCESRKASVQREKYLLTYTFCLDFLFYFTSISSVYRTPVHAFGIKVK